MALRDLFLFEAAAGAGLPGDADLIAAVRKHILLKLRIQHLELE
jgi:hypothetical protein